MFDFAKRIWREVRRLFDYTTLKTALGRELTLSQSMVEALESWGGMIYAYLEDYTGDRVCSKQLYEEALGN